MSGPSASNTGFTSGAPAASSRSDDSKAYPDSAWSCGGDYFNVNRISTDEVYVVWNIGSFLGQCCGKAKELRSDFFSFAGATWNLFISFDLKDCHSLFGINVRERRSSDEVLDCFCDITFKDSICWSKCIKRTQCEFRCEHVNCYRTKEDFLQRQDFFRLLLQGNAIHCEIHVSNRSNSIIKVCLPANVTQSSSSRAEETHTGIGLLKCYPIAFPDSAWFRVLLYDMAISAEEVKVIWKAGFFLSRYDILEIRSEAFSFAGATWNLFISFDPKKVHSLFGINVRERRSSNEISDCYCNTSLKLTNGTVIKNIECNFRCESSELHVAVTDFLLDSKLNEFMHEVLLIECQIREIMSIKKACIRAEMTQPSRSSTVDAYTQTQQLEKEDEALPMVSTESKVFEDFKNLLLSEEGSDVTLQVQDQQLKAHRTILTARSSYFAAMFRHDTKEKEMGVVEVQDCEPIAFRVLLDYMHCGCTEKLSVQNMFSLYTAADKYDLQDLKMKCLRFIQSHLSVETFCKTLRLSLQHSERNLLKLAEEFFIRNCQRIL